MNDGIVRPFRATSMYCAPCVDCGTEIETPVPDVPRRCVTCDKKWKAKLELAARPSPVRSISGAS